MFGAFEVPALHVAGDVSDFSRVEVQAESVDIIREGLCLQDHATRVFD